MQRLANAIGSESLQVILHALPRNVEILSACTGSGMAEIVVRKVLDEFDRRFPEADTDRTFKATNYPHTHLLKKTTMLISICSVVFLDPFAGYLFGHE